MGTSDDNWFAALYETAYRRLVLVALADARNLADAEEIIQEAFAAAYAHSRRVKAADDPEARIYTVARNIGRRRVRRRLLADRLLHREQPMDSLRDVPADHTDLYRALRALPDAQREVVFLHYLADLPLDEVARRVGVPVGTVKSRLPVVGPLAEQLGLRADVPDDAREGSRHR